MDIKVLGIDLGKTVCSLAGLDEAGAVVFRKRLQRHRLLDFLATLAPCVVAMEACGGAHHIGRFCLEKGHEPRLNLQQASIGTYRPTRDPPCVIGSKKGDNPADIVWLSDPTQRSIGSDRVTSRGNCCGSHVGFDQPRRDRINSNATRP